MSAEARNLVVEKEFGPELAGERIGWSAVTGYGKFRPDKVFGIHVATATIDGGGATLGYEEREKEGETTKAYWSDAAKGFIAMAGVTVIIDTEENLDERPRIGPYWLLKDDPINGSSSGRILRVAGDPHDEEKLEDIRVWAESSQAVVANVKQSMDDAGLSDYYPNWYYTINTVLGHEGIRDGTPLRQLPAEAVLLPDASMRESTEREVEIASSVADNLIVIDQIDETTMRNLTVFSDIPAEEIPVSFKASREKVFDTEAKVREAYKQLKAQTGIYMPIGSARTWPYMSADIKPTDERSFGRELTTLKQGDPSFARSELERERSELERRKDYAGQGVVALKLLAQAEASLA